MTASELLQPRYMVIADYPDSPFRIGQIITEFKDDYFEIESGMNVTGIFMNCSISELPHLFRRLNWWEYRKEEDLPKKVKHNRTNKVLEITSWDDTVCGPIAYYLRAGKEYYITFYNWKCAYIPIN
jgi:hypothetical protein